LRAERVSKGKPFGALFPPFLAHSRNGAAGGRPQEQRKGDPLRAKKRRLPRGHHPTVFANFNGIFSFALELNECPAVAAMIFHHFGKIVYPFW